MPSFLTFLPPVIFGAATLLAMWALYSDVRRFGADWLVLLRPSPACDAAQSSYGFREVRVRWLDTGGAIAAATTGHANVVAFNPAGAKRIRFTLAPAQETQFAIAA